MSTIIVSCELRMKILLTSRRGTIELVLDTDKIAGNAAISYITWGSQILMKLIIFIAKQYNNF
jgi:hypothetical protein